MKLEKENAMRKLILLSIISLKLLSAVKAQENLSLAQYVTGISVINPAYSGVNGRFTAQAISSNQWVGIEGAPRTNALLVNSPITSYKLGLGAVIINDKIGPSNTLGLNINIAYHTRVTEEINLSYGLKTIIAHYKEDYIGDQLVDYGDPYFQDNPGGKFYLNFGAGVYLSGKNFAIAYSATPLLRNKLKSAFEDEVSFYEINNTTSHYLMGFYAFQIKDKIVLKPSVLLKSSNNLKPTIDGSVTAIYNEKLWLGLTYKSNKAMSIYTQVQLTEKFRVGYAFDFGLSKEYSLNAGSHELVCSMDIQLKKKRFVTPRYL